MGQKAVKQRLQTSAKNVDPVCVECGKMGKLTMGSAVYAPSSPFAHRPIYLCECGAYVGCHKGSNLPLGKPAGQATRAARYRVHLILDPFWQARKAGHRAGAKHARAKAYGWLAREMGLKVEDCHVGHFTLEQCRQAEAIIRPYYDKLIVGGRTR